MKKQFLFMGVVVAVAWGGGSTVGAAPGGLPRELAVCKSELQACKLDLAELEAPPPAPVEQTGITRCAGTTAGQEIPCTGTGQDGEDQGGVPWPAPRFVNNGDGTVTDRLTGLIWLQPFCVVDTWDAVVALVKVLSRGICGLNDNSVAGNWRLPNVAELLSLVSWSGGGIAGGNTFPFSDTFVWSSTPSVERSEFGVAFWMVTFGANTPVQLVRHSRTSVASLMAVRR